MDRYNVGGVIGEGQFGQVKSATDKRTGDKVALKFIRIQRLSEGIPHPVAREITISGFVEHPCLVRTIDIFPHGASMVIAMERCAADLGTVLRCHSYTAPLPICDARWMLRDLLRGLAYLHGEGILHRDVKPFNCFLSAPPSRQLKLGDFGLSRPRGVDMSHEVASRWYRAPELLLGKRSYDAEIDMWSVGCVFAELLRGFGGALFPGDGDINQLSKIFDVLGTPSRETYGNLEELPDLEKVHFEPKNGCGLECVLGVVDPTALDLLKRLVCLNPSSRLTAKKALQHPFFYSTSTA